MILPADKETSVHKAVPRILYGLLGLCVLGMIPLGNGGTRGRSMCNDAGQAIAGVTASSTLFLHELTGFSIFDYLPDGNCPPRRSVFPWRNPSAAGF